MLRIYHMENFKIEVDGMWWAGRGWNVLEGIVKFTGRILHSCKILKVFILKRNWNWVIEIQQLFCILRGEFEFPIDLRAHEAAITTVKLTSSLIVVFSLGSKCWTFPGHVCSSDNLSKIYFYYCLICKNTSYIKVRHTHVLLLIWPIFLLSETSAEALVSLRGKTTKVQEYLLRCLHFYPRVIEMSVN